MPLPPPTPRELNALLAERELARRNYGDFLKYYIKVTRLDIHWAYYLDFLSDVLQAMFINNHFRRLLVNIPPRHWKSGIISQLLQAWMIGRDDNDRSSFLTCAATATLAARDSRKTINTIRSDWYEALFPNVHLRRENETEWETMNGARRMAAGRGGTVTGMGAPNIAVDDLLLANEAMSEVERPKANEWLGEVLASRLDDPKHGKIVVIMQRLHERDATGYLLEQAKIPGADQYEHICIPLEAPHRTVVQFRDKIYKIREADELIDPTRIGPDEVKALKVSMRVNFDGQYNQNPIRMQGGHLNPMLLQESTAHSSLDLLTQLGLVPDAYLDLATKEEQLEKDDPDENTITIAARDQFNRLVLLDVWGKVCGHEELANTLIAMHKLYGFRIAKVERGGLYNLFAPVLRTRMHATGHFLAHEPLPATNKLGDKVQRSIAFQAMLNAGAVLIPSRAKSPWLQKFESQTRAFPRGAHDDRLEGAFYSAIDFDNLRRGEKPPALMTATEQEQEQLKQRIQDAVDRSKQPDLESGQDW